MVIFHKFFQEILLPNELHVYIIKNTAKKFNLKVTALLTVLNHRNVSNWMFDYYWMLAFLWLYISANTNSMIFLLTLSFSIMAAVSYFKWFNGFFTYELKKHFFFLLHELWNGFFVTKTKESFFLFRVNGMRKNK